MGDVKKDISGVPKDLPMSHEKVCKICMFCCADPNMRLFINQVEHFYGTEVKCSRGKPQTSNEVQFSVNSPREGRPTLNQPSPTFRAPIRPPKHRKNTPQKTAFPYQYFFSVNMGWWRSPNFKQSSVFCQLTSWGLTNTQSTIPDLQGPHQTPKTSKKHPPENSISLSVFFQC